MNGAEANTAFAIIAGWRGQSLDDGERAAWKHQLWRMDADEFDLAIEAWGRGPKASYRPSLSDLWALIPSAEQPTPDAGPNAPWRGHGYEEAPTTGAGAAAERVFTAFAHLMPSRRNLVPSPDLTSEELTNDERN